MKPLYKSTPIMQPFSTFYTTCAKHGMTLKHSEQMYDELSRQECWRNSLYVVLVDRLPNGVTHLSIRRDDRAACRDWRHFQQIKNQLCGPEFEAVEIYPAESRVLDAANQFHLWVLPEGESVPLGFPTGGRSYDDVPGGKQRGEHETDERIDLYPPKPHPGPFK